jgi:hypothetical protein
MRLEDFDSKIKNKLIELEFNNGELIKGVK